MDLSLKQRLLGAAVLIALAVIFVPMFLSGSGPRQPEKMETTTLSIPPVPEREFQTRDLSVTPQAANSGERVASVDTATAPKPVDATPGTTPAAPAPQPEASKAEPPKPAASKPELAKPTAEAATSAREEAGIAANGRFYVHLGVYSSNRNAADLVAALKKGGFVAYSEATEFQGKPAERVRVGPFTDRAAAEATRLRIKRFKPSVPGSVIENADDARTDAAALPAHKAGAFAVQLGALKSAEDANKLRDRVRNAGFAAFVDKVNSNGTTLWRVRAGPEVERAKAEKLRDSIKDKLKLDGMIVAQ